MLMRLADEASNYPEACSLVYQRVLELRKKVAEIRLNQPPHGPHDSTCEATRYAMEPSTSKGIGFKKRDGKRMKKNNPLRSWTDNLRRKRRKVKSMQPSIHKVYFKHFFILFNLGSR